MTSYLVTKATDSQQIYVKMCLGDMRTATENGRSWKIQENVMWRWPPPHLLYARGLN